MFAENAGRVWPPYRPVSALHPPVLMSCIPPPRLRLLVYQRSMVSAANPCTSTQYVCPACGAGLILDVTEVTAGCEELGRFETCHDSRSEDHTSELQSLRH